MHDADSQSLRSSFLVRGGLWVAAQALLSAAVLALSLLCRTAHGHPVMTWLGIAMLAGGAVFALAGAWVLGSNLTPFPKPSAGSKLVRRGIYGLVRHPLYTGVFSAAAGWSLVWHSPAALAASLILAIFFDRKARREERWLGDKFPDYAAYSRETKKFVPWVY